MICKKCNHKLPDDSEFCQYCGNKINSEEVPETSSPDETLNEILKFEVQTKVFFRMFIVFRVNSNP